MLAGAGMTALASWVTGTGAALTAAGGLLLLLLWCLLGSAMACCWLCPALLDAALPEAIAAVAGVLTGDLTGSLESISDRMSPADPQDHCQGWVSASETRSPARLCPATGAGTNVSKGKINGSASPDNVHSTNVQLPFCKGLGSACMALCGCTTWDMLHLGDIQSCMMLLYTET